MYPYIVSMYDKHMNAYEDNLTCASNCILVCLSLVLTFYFKCFFYLFYQSGERVITGTDQQDFKVCFYILPSYNCHSFNIH